jgi:hypothetical protein
MCTKYIKCYNYPYPYSYEVGLLAVEVHSSTETGQWFGSDHTQASVSWVY